MTQVEAKRRFNDLKAEVEALELQNPDSTVLVFEKPSAVATSSVSCPLRRAILKRLILRIRSGEIWVEKSGLSWSGSRPWDDATMYVGVVASPRERDVSVIFFEADI